MKVAPKQGSLEAARAAGAAYALSWGVKHLRQETVDAIGSYLARDCWDDFELLGFIVIDPLYQKAKRVVGPVAWCAVPLFSSRPYVGLA